MKLIPESGMRNEFVIRGGGASFTTRQREMYEQLSEAAKKLNKAENRAGLSETDVRALCERVERRGSAARYPVKKNCDETIQYCGKESIFKRPEVPLLANRRRSVPDHHRNPRKWLKYSLDDVPNEDMSDRSNTRAAFSFLRELRARRDAEATQPDDSSTRDNFAKCKFIARVEFRAGKAARNDNVAYVEHDDKPEFRNGKVILPEYVVGGKRERRMKNVRRLDKMDQRDVKQLKLDHLHEEEIDDS